VGDWHVSDGPLQLGCFPHIFPHMVLCSYVLQAWMERFDFSIHKDQLLALYQMKYVEAEVLFVIFV